MATDSPPAAHILFLCHPLTGHLTPSLRVAADLHRRGWPVTFLGPTAHRARIIASGAAFLPLQDDANIDDLAYYDAASSCPPVPDYHSRPWQERALIDLEQHCLATIPTQWRCVQSALAHIHAQHPTRRVVILNEAFFFGLLPLFFGAPSVLQPAATLCLSVTPPLIRSIDLPPFDYPLPFATDPAGRARNAAAWAHCTAATAPLTALLGAQLAKAAAAAAAAAAAGDAATTPRRSLDPDTTVLDGLNYVVHDAVLQIGAPGFEYPRTDWPPHFQLIGFLPSPPPPETGYPNLPSWWEEVVTTNSSNKKIVVVAQGTVETNPHDLIIPTIDAMRDHSDDVLVVAILGRKGAQLPADFDVPANARVTDYLHYDAVLPYASAWVHNGGYGAVTHGVAHAVPMVVAGEGQDKPENIRRVRASGIGVGLGAAKPSVSDLRIGLEDVLSKAKYKERVAALRQESIQLDCFGRVEKAIVEALDRDRLRQPPPPPPPP